MNIKQLIGMGALLFLSNCHDASAQPAPKVTATAAVAKDAAKDVAKDVAKDAAKDATKDAKEATKDATKDAKEATKDATKDAKDAKVQKVGQIAKDIEPLPVGQAKVTVDIPSADLSEEFRERVTKREKQTNLHVFWKTRVYPSSYVSKKMQKILCKKYVYDFRSQNLSLQETAERYKKYLVEMSDYNTLQQIKDGDEYLAALAKFNTTHPDFMEAYCIEADRKIQDWDLKWKGMSAEERTAALDKYKAHKDEYKKLLKTIRHAQDLLEDEMMAKFDKENPEFKKLRHWAKRQKKMRKQDKGKDLNKEIKITKAEIEDEIKMLLTEKERLDIEIEKLKRKIEIIKIVQKANKNKSSESAKPEEGEQAEKPKEKKEDKQDLHKDDLPKDDEEKDKKKDNEKKKDKKRDDDEEKDRKRDDDEEKDRKKDDEEEKDRKKDDEEEKDRKKDDEEEKDRKRDDEEEKDKKKGEENEDKPSEEKEPADEDKHKPESEEQDEDKQK